MRRAGAGCSPRRARHFSLLRQRKVPKRKATPSLRPLRCATGQTCGGALAGCAVELALLLRSAARTATASQITKHARSDARATPQPPRRRRSQQGVNSQTAIRVVAALDPKKAAPCARRLRPQQRAERSNGPRGCWDPPPLCMRRGAQRPADQGSRLSERSEFERDPAGREHRRLPRSAAQGTQTVGSPSFAFFSWRRKKRRCAAGRTSRQTASSKARSPKGLQHPATSILKCNTEN